MRRTLLGPIGRSLGARSLVARSLGPRSLIVAMALIGMGAIPFHLKAQPPAGPPPSDSGDVNDPPSRAARLGMIQGNVSFQPGGVEDWVPATLNRPVSTGDRLWTDAGANLLVFAVVAAVFVACGLSLRRVPASQG